MNLEVTGVSEPPISRPDLSDRLVLVLVAGGFVASWTYVFMHPSPEAFGICVAGVGTFVAAFHAIRVHDDKQPDRKDG
jgi:hypothetical protein